MSFHPYTQTPTDQKAIDRIRIGKELLEERIEHQVERIKSAPKADKNLIAALHEEEALKQMNKHYSNFKATNDIKHISRFWDNQKKFLEFIILKYPKIIRTDVNSGYVYSHSWFLHNNEDAYKRLMSIPDIQKFRGENWKEYNSLCLEMHARAPKYKYLDSFLIKC